MTVEYVDRLPTPSEHRMLCESVGWGPAFDFDAMPAASSATAPTTSTSGAVSPCTTA